MIKKFENYKNDDFYNEEEWEDDEYFDYNIENIMQDIEGTYVDKLTIIQTWLEENFIVNRTRIYDNKKLYFEFQYNTVFKKNKIGYGTITWEMITENHPLSIRLIVTFGIDSSYMLGSDKSYWKKVFIKEKVPVRE